MLLGHVISVHFSMRLVSNAGCNCWMDNVEFNVKREVGLQRASLEKIAWWEVNCLVERAWII